MKRYRLDTTSTKNAAISLQFEQLEERIALTIDVSGEVFWDANRNGLDDDPVVSHESVLVEVVGDDDTGGSMTVPLTSNRADYTVTGIEDETIASGTTPSFDAADVTASPASGFELTSPLANTSATTDSYATLANFPITRPSWVESADLDGRNGPDLIVTNFVAPKLTVLLNDGTGKFPTRHEIPIPTNSTSIDQADFDGDGDIDLVVGNINSSFLTVLINDGSGTFLAPSSQLNLTSATTGPSSVVAADVNADGRTDIVASEFPQHRLSVHLNQSTDDQVSFAPVSSIDSGSGSVTVVAADLLGQPGLPSLVVLNKRDDQLLIYNNDGAGGFSYSGNSVPAMEADAVVSGRIDDDAFEDVALYSQSAQRLFIYFGDGAGGFTDLRDPQTLWYPRGIALADMDGDGDTDIVANLTDDFGITVLRNEGGRQISDALPIFEVPLDPIVEAPPALADFNGDGVIDIAAAPKWLGATIDVSFRQLEPGSHTVRTNEGNVTGQNFGIARVVSPTSTAAGDYDGDNIVNGLDLEVWKANLGKTAGPGISADSNGSDRVDGADFLNWQRNFGNNVVAVAASPVATEVAVASTPAEDESLEEAAASNVSATVITSLNAAHPTVNPIRTHLTETQLRDEVFHAAAIEYHQFRAGPKASDLAETLVSSQSEELLLSESSLSVEGDEPFNRNLQRAFDILLS